MYYYEERDPFGKYRSKTSAVAPKKISAEGRKSLIRRLRLIGPADENLDLQSLREIYGTPTWVEECDFSFELTDRYPFSHYEAATACFEEKETLGTDESHTACTVKRGHLLGVTYERNGNEHYLPRAQALDAFGAIAVNDLEESTIPYRNPPGGE